MQFFQSTAIWRIVVALLLLLLGWRYVRGWRRLHAFQPQLANKTRLTVFGVSLVALTVSLISPLETWSHYLLVARSTQKVLLCMIAAPLFWLACPFHFTWWGLPSGLRQRTTHLFLPHSRFRRLLQSVTQPGFTWLLFVSTFLSWHDPSLVNFIMPHPWGHRAALIVLLGAALLFWWHIVDTGPRIHRRFPDWVRFACLLGVEIPNIASGITLAFQTRPLYSYYAAMNGLTPPALHLAILDDQTISGGIIWVFGSLAYFSSAVLVLNKIFQDHGGNSPQPIPNWDSDERMIAPGLEHRLVEKRWRDLERP